MRFRCVYPELEALQTTSHIFKIIDELRSSVCNSIHDALADELRAVLNQNVFDELDMLSTHTTVEEADIESFSILGIDENSIYLSGSGLVGCELQYGSNYDVKNDVGCINSHSLPFNFTGIAPVSNPHKISINPLDVLIDDSGWYE